MGANSLTYDVKGNLTSKTSSNSPLQALEWDIDNHLKTASVDNINFANYEYDALGRRVAKTLANGDKTVYVLCGQKVCAEYTNGSISNKYVWGTYIDDLIAIIDGPSTLYAHSDRQYNVRGLTDSNGNIIELNAYTPYGTKETFDATGAPLASSATVYGFTGRRLDSETGLWYFRARYFDTEMGRFISRDSYAGADKLGNASPLEYARRGVLRNVDSLTPMSTLIKKQSCTVCKSDKCGCLNHDKGMPWQYTDGMGLYNGYFASQFLLDPTGHNPALPAIIIGGITIKAAHILGISVCACLLSSTCRALIVELVRREAMCVAYAAGCVGSGKPCQPCYARCMNEGRWPTEVCPNGPLGSW